MASWFLSPIASGICAAILYAVTRYGIMSGGDSAYFRAKVFFPRAPARKSEASPRRAPGRGLVPSE